MKKFLLIFLIALLSLTCAFSCVAFADDGEVPAEPTSPDDADSEQSAAIYEDAEFLQQLCDFNKNDLPQAKSTFLIDTFRAVLAEQGIDEKMVEDRQISVNYNDEVVPVLNIEAVLDNGDDSADCIVIGAHYDSKGEGANDNASGVTALYRVLKTLAAQATSLPFDVRFVAFDCEEDGLVGSYAYVQKQLGAPVIVGEETIYKGVSLDKVKVMFNIDSIALGQNLYLACENKSTNLAKLICAQEPAIQEKPYGLGVTNGIDYYGYGYYEKVQDSDHTPFRVNGVPTAAVFSGKYGALGYIDDSGVQNTERDTFENLSKADYLGRIETVSNLICGTVMDENFVTVAQNARNQLVNLDAVYNRWWVSLAVAGVLVVLVIFACLYYRKLQKQAILGVAEVKQNNVFEKPDAEDIFSFDGDAKKDSSQDEADDIFTFKK